MINIFPKSRSQYCNERSFSNHHWNSRSLIFYLLYNLNVGNAADISNQGFFLMFQFSKLFICPSTWSIYLFKSSYWKRSFFWKCRSDWKIWFTFRSFLMLCFIHKRKEMRLFQWHLNNVVVLVLGLVSFFNFFSTTVKKEKKESDEKQNHLLLIFWKFKSIQITYLFWNCIFELYFWFVNSIMSAFLHLLNRFWNLPLVLIHSFSNYKYSFCCI